MLEVIEQEGLIDNVAEQGGRLKKGLATLAGKYNICTEVRGQGLLLGLACQDEVAPIVTACREAGLLLLSAGPKVLRLLPPLNVTAEEVDEALSILDSAFAGAK